MTVYKALEPCPSDQPQVTQEEVRAAKRRETNWDQAGQEQSGYVRAQGLFWGSRVFGEV